MFKLKDRLEKMSTNPTNDTIVEDELPPVPEEETEDQENVEAEVSEIDQLRADYKALEDRFLRQAADFQNVRRRSLEDRALSLDIGRNQVALPMLDILDDLSRSLEAADAVSEEGSSKAFEALLHGVQLVEEKFVSELDKLGIRPMECVGTPFDEELHEALMQQPAPEGTEAGTILAEIQKGYKIGDRVLRHARVVVAS